MVMFFFSLIELVDRKFILELLVFNNAANALDLGVDHQIIDGGGRGGGGGWVGLRNRPEKHGDSKKSYGAGRIICKSRSII